MYSFVYHWPMVVIPIKKAFASHSYTVVSKVHVTHDDPLSTTTAYSWQKKYSRLPLWSHGTSLLHNPQPTGFYHGGEEYIALDTCLQQQQQPTSTTKFACSRYHYAWEMCRWSVVPAQHNAYARLPMGLHCIIKSYPVLTCRCFKPLTTQSRFILIGSTASVYCCIVNN